MRRINKGKQPLAWVKFANTPGRRYERIPELTEALLKEQGCICAYCEARISDDCSRVEHIKPRSLYTELELDYNNMVICCNGNENRDCENHHCDVSKANQEISLDLFSDHFFESLSYDSKGTLSSSNKDWNDEIESILNLNMSLLKRNRRVVWDTILEELSKKNNKVFSKGSLKKALRTLEELDKNGKFVPYASMAIGKLKKRLKNKKVMKKRLKNKKGRE